MGLPSDGQHAKASAGACAQVLIYGDCAVNVHPSSSELAQIAVTSADTAAAFGIEPRVALLSYSTFGSGSGPEVDRVGGPCFTLQCRAAQWL
jgi:phosphotransacetylase